MILSFLAKAPNVPSYVVIALEISPVVAAPTSAAVILSAPVLKSLLPILLFVAKAPKPVTSVLAATVFLVAKAPK